MREDLEAQDPAEKLVREVKFRQRNTTYPDLIVNASNSEALMWHGSNRMTKVQRIGVGIFGFLFLLAGASMIIDFISYESWLRLPIGLAFGAVVYKVLWNSVRKNDPSKTKHE